MIINKTRIAYFMSIVLALPALVAAGHEALAERPFYEPSTQRNNQRGLSGTWELDTSRSDDSEREIDRAIRNLPANDRERYDRILTRRLSPPENIAIEQEGRHFTIASNRGRQISFDATGRTRTETSVSGRQVQVNARLTGDSLMISSRGDRGRDYQVTFDPIDRGRSLRVTRQISVDRLPQPVTVTSVYNKSADSAQLDLYRGGGYGYVNDRSDRSRNSFVVPNGTSLVAVINQDLNTKNVREGDPVSLVVRSPRQYENAVIEGTITNVERSGRVSGRAGISFDFDRIRMPNGETRRFAGYVESIRVPGGEDVRIDNEGSIRDEDSQTKRTVTRTGIGAALGAVVGAIAGGGKGAAIGAAIGGGAGAGSVFVQGRDDLELRNGTEFTIHAATPRDTEARR